MGKGRKTKEKAPRPSHALVNLAEIKGLLNLMAEKGISEFELERAGMRIHLKRAVNSLPPEGHSADIQAGAFSRDSAGHNSPPPAGRALSSGPMNLRYSEPVYLGGESEAVPFVEERKEEREELATENLHLVKSPIVGTFYEAPAPEAEPFVHVGDTVEVGQVLCVIEAMKLMNEIESDIAGEVVKRYVSNAQPVEYGEILFAIRPKRQLRVKS